MMQQLGLLRQKTSGGVSETEATDKKKE